MSQRLLRALGGTTAIVVVTSLLGPAPAEARESDPAPRTIAVTAKAKGPNHFNSSISVDVPAGGSAMVTSPSLDPNMKKANIDFATPLSDLPDFEDMTLVLLQQPSPAHRIVSCAVMSAFGAVGDEGMATITDSLESYEAVAQTRFLTRLLLCVKLAQLIASVLAEQNARTLRAGAACGQTPIAVKEKITKSGGQYHLTAKAPKVKPSKMRVKVKCTVGKGGKVSAKIKPKKKRSTLRKALAGPNIGTGIASPSSAEDGAKVKVSFKVP